MSKQPIITPLSTATGITTATNANNEEIKKAFDNTLSRDGSTPNNMEADLDLNSNDLLNVGNITTQDLTVGGSSVASLASETAANAQIAADAAVAAQAAADSLSDGVDGQDGDSAYEVAVAEGFVGNEAAWLASLVGDNGKDGSDGTNGTDGIDGNDGAPGSDGADSAFLSVATEAEALAGTNNTAGMTPLRVAQAIAPLPVTKEFTSAQQTITAAAQLTLPHGLGAIPKIMTYELVCITAQAGYSPGDTLEVLAGFASDPNTGSRTGGLSVIKDATNIIIRYANNSPVFHGPSSDTGQVSFLDNVNFELVVRAFA